MLFTRLQNVSSVGKMDTPKVFNPPSWLIFLFHQTLPFIHLLPLPRTISSDAFSSSIERLITKQTGNTKNHLSSLFYNSSVKHFPSFVYFLSSSPYITFKCVRLVYRTCHHFSRPDTYTTSIISGSIFFSFVTSIRVFPSFVNFLSFFYT